MSFLGNLLWLILGGLVIALIYFIVGLLFCVEVSLTLMERPDNKCAKLLAHVPGGNLMIERSAATFEEAVNEAVDAMKEKIKRNKEKRAEA